MRYIATQTSTITVKLIKHSMLPAGMDIAFGIDLDAVVETASLLKQVCLRLDRQFPDGEQNRDAALALLEAERQLKDVADKLEKLDLVELANSIRGLI